MAAKLVRSSSLLLLAMALWTSSCVLLPAAMADHTVQPASVSSAQLSIGAAGKPDHHRHAASCIVAVIRRRRSSGAPTGDTCSGGV
ncbi:unnamed protein product [Miscanthus lutarioriparius]|uniref:Uncharacterized protein n=1 Tax=Miscanthus lutarioriparius TaxID=422564 RepID=A0A811R9W8_9POAL|nr:unnamed protein product [Miscanthus lutarioriparius]